MDIHAEAHKWYVFQLEPVIEEDQEERKEKKKKHKHKKKKKHREEEREQLIETKQTNLDQNLSSGKQEQQWNVIDLPQNIPSEPSKQSTELKFARRNSERGLLPKFKPPEDSDTGTDNALQGIMRPGQRVSGLSMSPRRTSAESSPRTVAWKPGSKVIKDDSSEEDKVQHKKPPKSPSSHRSRFSNEVIGLRDVSSDDSETTSRRSFQKLKKKKKKRRHMRNLSDSDDI